MKINATIILQLYFIFMFSIFYGQKNLYTNGNFIKNLYSNPDYINLKEKVVKEFAHSKSGTWGEFVKGVDEDLVTNKKIVAFTFDACGGKNANGYDSELIEYLREQKITVTLFVTGKWIDANYATFLQLSVDPLFEIENHGFNHQPCSVGGESEFGITIISFDILSGDAIPNVPKTAIESNVLKNIKPGAIIIMHFNRPKWNTFEALQSIIPELKKQGYTFAKLKDFPLKSKN